MLITTWAVAVAFGVAESLTSFVMAIDDARGLATSQPVRFAAALFSWGDVARAAVFLDPD